MVHATHANSSTSDSATKKQHLQEQSDLPPSLSYAGHAGLAVPQSGEERKGVRNV